MAPEWEAAAAAMGSMDLGMGIHHAHAAYGHNTTTMAPAAVPMSHHHGFSHAPAGHHFYAADDHMRVDQLLDLSTGAGAAHDFFPAAGAAPSPAAASSDHHASSTFNLSFTDEYYIPVPSEEAAELEWLSNFVDDSYPDMPNYPPEVQAAIAAGQQAHNSSSSSSSSATAAAAAPGRGARSKRSRASAAAAAAWCSLVPSSSPSDAKPARSGGSSSSGGGSKKSSGSGGGENPRGEATEGGVRRCTHCASERTPQWRTGPLGPKTLCNACGVRYKSGRLVPEYRPAASPTFVLTQHSNSHRKVMELRRQKELMLLRGNAAAAGSGSAAAELMFRDYGVC